jgi:hypothetical protein
MRLFEIQQYQVILLPQTNNLDLILLENLVRTKKYLKFCAMKLRPIIKNQKYPKTTKLDRKNKIN